MARIYPDYFCRVFAGESAGDILCEAILGGGSAPLVRITFFTSACGPDADAAVEAARHAVARCGHAAPVWNLVAQAPVGASLAAEAHYRAMGPGDNVSYRRFGQIPYIVVENGAAREMFLSVGRHNVALPSSPGLQAAEVFGQAGALMAREGFPVGSVVRQWNYVEGITLSTSGCQHYQAMNDARSAFYAGGEWDGGYPAATGIGTDGGGVSVEINAATGLHTATVDNPLQRAAHAYTRRVLEAGNAPDPSTPKFERARTVGYPSGTLTYISGTAAIRSEDSLGDAGAVRQTEVTLENIAVLTRLTGAQVVSARVYLKNAGDYDAVMPAVRDAYPDASLLFTRAEVCRPELLVEIEALAWTHTDH